MTDKDLQQPADKDVESPRRQSMFPGFSQMADRRKDLADQLVELRVDLGLSQTEVAARMGTSQSAVARIESGEADIRLSTLERYASALGRVVDFHIQGENP